MTTPLPTVLALAALFGIQNASQPQANPSTSTEAPVSTAQQDPTTDRARQDRLEHDLAQTLTNSVFTGSWQLLEGDGLSEPKPEKYTIVSAKKLSGDLWLITARIEFAEKDVTVPLPLRIVWAGDTAVITVTDLHVPGIGKYSARVMIYRDLYSGAWFGEGYGGLLSGRISRLPVNAPPTAPEAAEDAAPSEPRANQSSAAATPAGSPG